jgi:hypothetical protein
MLDRRNPAVEELDVHPMMLDQPLLDHRGPKCGETIQDHAERSLDNCHRFGRGMQELNGAAVQTVYTRLNN